MTIKKFASICGCNTQTLRYYDRIGLLKPIRVDQWSGYRYYDPGQAVEYVKIKNLQEADFSIEEIRVLLTMSDQLIAEAFDRKIMQQEQKLERIRKIKQSYLTEKSNMERLVHNLSDYLLHAVTDYEVLREFGLFPEDGERIVARLRDYIERVMLRHMPSEPDIRMQVDNKIFRGAEQIAEVLSTMKDSGYEETVLLGDEHIREEEGFTSENSETVWHLDGWNYVYEFLDQIPPLEPGFDYCFFFELTEGKYRDGLEFPMFMIAAMMIREDADELVMGCCLQLSTDGKNHFELKSK